MRKSYPNEELVTLSLFFYVDEKQFGKRWLVSCRFGLQLIKQKMVTSNKVQETIYSLTEKMVNLTLFKDLCCFTLHFIFYIFGQIYIFLNEDTYVWIWYFAISRGSPKSRNVLSKIFPFSNQYVAIAIKMNIFDKLIQYSKFKQIRN